MSLRGGTCVLPCRLVALLEDALSNSCSYFVPCVHETRFRLRLVPGARNDLRLPFSLILFYRTRRSLVRLNRIRSFGVESGSRCTPMKRSSRL